LQIELNIFSKHCYIPFGKAQVADSFAEITRNRFRHLAAAISSFSFPILSVSLRLPADERSGSGDKT
jgi:hypothetical protein